MLGRSLAGRSCLLALQLQSKQRQKSPYRKRSRLARKGRPVASASVDETGIDGEAKKRADEKRLAVAAKISAARALARRLASEQETALAAARSAAGHSLDEEEVEAIKRSVEASSAAAAHEAAEAGAKIRQARRGIVSSEQLSELARLKEENENLQRLVFEMATNKNDARKRVASLRANYNQLVKEIARGEQLSGNGAATLETDAAAVRGAVEATPEREADIMEVIRKLAAARTAADDDPFEDDSSHSEDDDDDPSELDPVAVWRQAREAVVTGNPIFYFPEDGIPIRASGRVYYNAAAGNLPEKARVQLKLGINKWQDILLVDMHRDWLLQDQKETDWWSAALCFDEDVYQIDFVVLDANSQTVDNNRAQDYKLPLLNALTEEQILEKQAAALAEIEERRLQMVEAEEERRWQEAREIAFKQADQARAEARQQFEARLWADAAAAATEQRSQLVGISPQESWEGVLIWARPPVAGQTAIALYNKESGPLRHSEGVTMHCGFDGWQTGISTLTHMSAVEESQREDLKLPDYGEWWQGSIDIPRTAEVLDFVLSCPNKSAWDNNQKRDFHVSVREALDREQLIQYFFDEAWREGQSELELEQDNAAKKTIRKMEEKAKALRKRRQLQGQIFYSNPPTPQAGQQVDLFYNPDITSLRGRPEIWVQGCFNRWTHEQKFGPIQLHPVVRGGAGFHKVKIQVPQDAWIIDFVVSDSPDGGAFYDNNNGMDYHIEVNGSSLTQTPLNVVHVAVEMAPIAKVGGMADVVTALSRAVKEDGHDVKVILPKYDVINYDEVRDIVQTKSFNWNNTEIKVWEGVVEGLVTVFLEPCNGSVWAGCIYGRNDDAARFGFFCGAAMDYLKHHYDAPMPHIIHAHDWQSAPVIFGDVHPARSVFTIHNMEFGVHQIGTAMGAASVATTVSPTYAVEVSGHPAIAPHLAKFYGIRNGIDQDIWDPLFDRHIPRGFSGEDPAQGKADAKAELRRRMDLSSADVPLVSVVTRLTHQKGIHLIKHAAWRTLERGGQFVLLGSAPDPRVQGDFNALAGEIARQYPDRARFWFAYDEPLSHLIYAGSDLFLVPSMFEPCGLTQMIAMRYGTIPVVRKTGGLNDTVFDVDDDLERANSAGMQTNGFSFVGADPAGLDYALNRALEVWYTDKAFWQELTQRVMAQDWSWAEPAADYCEIYYKALKAS